MIPGKENDGKPGIFPAVSGLITLPFWCIINGSFSFGFT
jgi:hypothetical protein